GRGNWLNELDYLVPHFDTQGMLWYPKGATVIDGNGNQSYYPLKDGTSDEFDPADGRIGYLERTIEGYKITNPDGSYRLFGLNVLPGDLGTWYLTKRVDRLGNETTYAYQDITASHKPQLTSIT